MKKLMQSLLFLMFLSNSAMSQAVLKINGNSEAQVAPDEAIVYLNVEGSGSDTEKANNEAERKLRGIQDILQDLGYSKEELKVSSAYIRAIRKYNEKRPSGYIASFYCQMQLPAKSIAVTKLIEAISVSEIDVSSSVQFRISKTLAKIKKDELIAQAIGEARSKADLIARNVDMEVATVSTIEYGIPQSNPVFRGRAMEMAADTENGVEFELRKQTLSESIYMEFILKPEQ